MSTRTLFTKLQYSSKNFIQNSQFLKAASVTWCQVVTTQYCIRDRKFLFTCNIREELLPVHPHCSASIQLHSLVDCNKEHSCVAAGSTVMAMNVQLAAEWRLCYSHRLATFEKRLHYKCTIFCRQTLHGTKLRQSNCLWSQRHFSHSSSFGHTFFKNSQFSLPHCVHDQRQLLDILVWRLS